MWEKIKVDRMTLLLPSELNKLNYPNLLNKLNNPYAIHLFNQLILFTIQGLTPKSLLPVRVIPCVSVAIKVIQTGSTRLRLISRSAKRLSTGYAKLCRGAQD